MGVGAFYDSQTDVSRRGKKSNVLPDCIYIPGIQYIELHLHSLADRAYCATNPGQIKGALRQGREILLDSSLVTRRPFYFSPPRLIIHSLLVSPCRYVAVRLYACILLLVGRRFCRHQMMIVSVLCSSPCVTLRLIIFISLGAGNRNGRLALAVDATQSPVEMAIMFGCRSNLFFLQNFLRYTLFRVHGHCMMQHLPVQRHACVMVLIIKSFFSTTLDEVDMRIPASAKGTLV